MRSASIISIGNEVLSGQTIDTNASYLSRRLFEIGIGVVSFYTVGDEVDPIVRALRLASDDASVVLTTGGLGPTDDDLTRQAFAKFLGTELELRSELMNEIQAFFARRGLWMSEKNKSQAYLPAGTTALENEVGTAAGMAAEVNGKLLFALPGVPSEMMRMFEQCVQERLMQLADRQSIAVRKLRCFGTGESNIAQLLGSVMQRGRNPLVNSTASCGLITLHVIATAQDSETAKEMTDRDETLIRAKLGDLVYGTGDQTIADIVGEKLTAAAKTIAVAESCTGGLLAKLITDTPGASNYFTRGWVVYSNAAKVNELGVPAELIDAHGAVSEPVVRAMAGGARTRAHSDFAIGITGIAGPGGGSEHKPVGTVYIGVASNSGCDTKRFTYSGSRDSIRMRAAQTTLNVLRLKLKN
jgi:nicotinamide-nucleotide amidase